MRNSLKLTVVDPDLANSKRELRLALAARLDRIQRRWQTLFYFVGIAATVAVASLLAFWNPLGP